MDSRPLRPAALKEGNRFPRHLLPALRRLTPRNLTGFWRYALLRLRFPALDGGLFFIDRGAEVQIAPSAEIRFGPGVRFMRDATVHVEGRLSIGRDVFFNRGCHVVVHEELTIGDYCLFGEMVSIHDENHVAGPGAEPIAARGFQTAKITIDQNVWVGAKATILPGVHIGHNAVIAANAVVTRDVPANTVAAGVPARVIRTLTQEA